MLNLFKLYRFEPAKHVLVSSLVSKRGISSTLVAKATSSEIVLKQNSYKNDHTKSLQDTSLQDIVEKNVFEVATCSGLSMNERKNVLRSINTYLLKNFEKENVNYLLNRTYNFENYSRFSYNTMLSRSLSMYFVMFDQKVFWRELSSTAKYSNHLKKDNFIHTWIVSGLRYHEEKFTEKTVVMIHKFFERKLSNSEFLEFFEICLNEGYEVLNEKDLMFYFDRIVKTNDESSRRIVEKDFLTMKSQYPKVEEMHFKKSLLKILPTSYFTVSVKYFTNKIDREETDFKLIKCHADCAQMSFDEKVKNNVKISLPEMLELMKAHYSSVRGRMFRVQVPEKTILDSFTNFHKILLYVDERKSKYQYVTFQDFIAESLSIFSKLDLDGEKFEIFQHHFMPIFLNWMLHSTKSENHTIERLNTRSKLKKNIWDMFFTSFLNITQNDTHKLFLFLEKLDPSVILMLQKYDLLKYFNYSPSKEFMVKAEEYFAYQKQQTEGSFLDLMTENIANEEFLASFYYNVCIPLVQDTVGFRDLYYEYCVNRDKYFTTPDRDIIACAFVDYALVKLNSYWIAFFIARTQYYKPAESQNLGPGNPVLHLLNHPKFILPQTDSQSKLAKFHRYTNNITRCINISGNKLDGFLVLAFIEKAYKLRLWKAVEKWYLVSYYKNDRIEYLSVLDEFVNTDIFEYICKNDLPILTSNPYLVEFSRKYNLLFPSENKNPQLKQTDFELATEKTLEKMKREEEKKKAELLDKQSVIQLAKQSSMSQSSTSLVNSTVKVGDLLSKINIDSVDIFKTEEENYKNPKDFELLKNTDILNDHNGSFSSESANEVVEACFVIYKSLIDHVIQKDVKATNRDYASEETIQEANEDRKKRADIKKKRLVDNY